MTPFYPSVGRVPWRFWVALSILVPLFIWALEPI